MTALSLFLVCAIVLLALSAFVLAMLLCSRRVERHHERLERHLSAVLVLLVITVLWRFALIFVPFVASRWGTLWH